MGTKVSKWRWFVIPFLLGLSFGFFDLDDFAFSFFRDRLEKVPGNSVNHFIANDYLKAYATRIEGNRMVARVLIVNGERLFVFDKPIEDLLELILRDFQLELGDLLVREGTEFDYTEAEFVNDPFGVDAETR